MLKNALALLHPDVGVFCDLTRDAIKGDAFIERAPGFVNGGEGREQDILRAVIGWRDGWGEYTPRSCSQIVNYVSAHDNFTLWDKLVMCLGVNGDEAGAADLDGLWADVLEQNKLAAFICFTCQGRLFFQAGEEFGRTKLGEGNSFRSPPRLNMLCWERVRRFEGLTDYYRQLIRLRKSLPGLCDKSPAAAERVTARSIRRPKVVSFQVERGGPLGERLLIAYNASDRPFSLSLPHGRWIVRADGRSADQRRPAQRNEIGIPPCSGVLLLREGD